MNIANNPVAANALIFTNAQNAENLGNVANGAIAVRDVLAHSTGLPEVVGRGLAAYDMKEGYLSAMDLLHEWAQDATKYAVPTF